MRRGRFNTFSAVATGGLVVAACLNSSPVAVVENTSSTEVAVRLETDLGESYLVGTVAPGAAARISISGRDKALWAVVEFPGSRIVRSKELYATTQGTVRARVSNGFVELTYVL